MKRIIGIITILVLVLAIVSACGGGSSTSKTTTSSTQMPGTPVQVEGGGSYWTITPAQLHDMLAKKDFFMVNTDIAYTGEIEGTDLFVKPDALNQNLDKFPADKSKKIVVYCAAGVSSQPAAAALVKAGYTRVMQLKGGMIEWQRQGYPILNKSKTETGTTTTSGGM